MKITVSKTWDYTPEWNGNREDESPIKFVIKNMTPLDIEPYVTASKEETNTGEKMNQLFKDMVVKIENLEVNGENVEKPEDFLSIPSMVPLFNEVILKVTESINKGPTGN